MTDPTHPPVLEDWDTLLADPPFEDPHRSRKLKWGSALGVIPQLVLVLWCVFMLMTGNGPYAVLAVLLNIYIVPIAVLVGVPCLLSRASRPFGGALLATTLLGALVSTVICTLIAQP